MAKDRKPAEKNWEKPTAAADCDPDRKIRRVFTRRGDHPNRYVHAVDGVLEFPLLGVLFAVFGAFRFIQFYGEPALYFQVCNQRADRHAESCVLLLPFYTAVHLPRPFGDKCRCQRLYC